MILLIGAYFVSTMMCIIFISCVYVYMLYITSCNNTFTKCYNVDAPIVSLGTPRINLELSRIGRCDLSARDRCSSISTWLSSPNCRGSSNEVSH